jgi:hypothetical protein
MREEIESRVFSPESKQIAQDILTDATKMARDPENDEWFADAIDDDWWTQQEPFGAPLNIETDSPVDDAIYEPKRQKSFIEQQTDDIMKRVTSAPLPSAAHFKKLATEAKKTKRSFKKLAREMPAPRVGANLQHRPFLILSTLRDDLTK